MNAVDAKKLREMIFAASDDIVANEQYLCELDSYVGDGDHGVTVARGFRAVKEALSAENDLSIAALLVTTGDALTESMGGAIGPIFGSIFTAMGENAEDISEIDTAKMAALFRAALEEVQLVGGAQAGDRTLVDALVPAVEALEKSAAAGDTLTNAMQMAAQAAQQGAEATKDMVAKKGRAKFLQEKSKGYQDAGATSMTIVLQAMAKHAQ